MTVFSNFTSSKTPQTNQRNITSRWHKVLTYTGLEAIKHLKEHTNGAKVEDPEEAPKTINCELCLVSKTRHLISCHIGSEEPATKPFERVAFDLILTDRGNELSKEIAESASDSQRLPIPDLEDYQHLPTPFPTPSYTRGSPQPQVEIEK